MFPQHSLPCLLPLSLLEPHLIWGWLQHGVEDLVILGLVSVFHGIPTRFLGDHQDPQCTWHEIPALEVPAAITGAQGPLDTRASGFSVWLCDLGQLCRLLSYCSVRWVRPVHLVLKAFVSTTVSAARKAGSPGKGAEGFRKSA